MKNRLRYWREKLIFITDLFIIVFCYFAAYFIRFDGLPTAMYLGMAARTLPLMLFVRTIALFYFKLHTGLREYASIRDLIQILKAVSTSSVMIVAVLMFKRIEAFPRSIFIIDWLLLVIGLSGTRFVIRLTRPARQRLKEGNSRLMRRRVLIVGAGDAGEMLSREMI